MPKKVRHRKQHRGRLKGNSKGQTEITFGEFGIQALEPGWVTARQIEAARIASSKDKAKLPPAGHITLSCASADCRLFRS